jgi:hypothetical protein
MWRCLFVIFLFTFRLVNLSLKLRAALQNVRLDVFYKSMMMRGAWDRGLEARTDTALVCSEFQSAEGSLATLTRKNLALCSTVMQMRYLLLIQSTAKLSQT